MKNIKKIALAVFVGTLFSAFFSAMCVSCYKPSPLYGAWADNAGIIAARSRKRYFFIRVVGFG